MINREKQNREQVRSKATGSCSFRTPNLRSLTLPPARQSSRGYDKRSARRRYPQIREPDGILSKLLLQGAPYNRSEYVVTTHSLV